MLDVCLLFVPGFERRSVVALCLALPAACGNSPVAAGFSIEQVGDTVKAGAGASQPLFVYHLKPESDWPDAHWYAFTLKLANGSQIGAAVMNHPANPATLWHNHRDVRMLNPCIVAPGEVKLKAGQRLTLRYRLVTFDGLLPTERLNRLADEWRAR